MKDYKAKTFNLNKKRPQVLFLGNGILLSGDKGKRWDQVLDDLKDKNKADFPTKDNGVPYSIKALMVCADNDIVRRKKYFEYFNPSAKEKSDNSSKYEYSETNLLLEKLLSLNFDSIITTNYTYEIESFFKKDYVNLARKNNYAFELNKKIKKNESNDENDIKKESVTKLLNVCALNIIPDKKGESHEIWHIHGEARNKSSFVLTHDEYPRLIHSIVEYNRRNGNRYELCAENLEMRSWIDYFIMGDVYILGFGFDFSEIDLWWLLNRRHREKEEVGVMHFFEPQKGGNETSDVKEVLKRLNVRVHDMDVEIKNTDDYILFYQKSIKKINEMVKERRQNK